MSKSKNSYKTEEKFIDTDMTKVKMPPKKKVGKYKRDWQELHAENEDECYY